MGLDLVVWEGDIVLVVDLSIVKGPGPSANHMRDMLAADRVS